MTTIGQVLQLHFSPVISLEQMACGKKPSKKLRYDGMTPQLLSSYQPLIPLVLVFAQA
jgi:hypothetical protein